MKAERWGRVSVYRACSRGTIAAVISLGLSSLGLSCSRPPARTETTAPKPSLIKVEVKPGGPIVLTTSSAAFQILPSGYIQASLLKGDQRLTLDQPGTEAGNLLVQDGKAVEFALDFSAAKVEESVGKLGPGKRVAIPARMRDSSTSSIEEMLQIEVV